MVQAKSTGELTSSIQMRALETRAANETVHGTVRGRRVLLIGGAGYIGVPVARRLVESGYLVRTLDRLVYQNGSSLVGQTPDPASAFIFGDMGDGASLDRALDGVTDIVILAGLVGDPITKKFPQESHAINEEALRRCIDRLDRRGLNKVVFISTCSNYGMIADNEVAHEGFALNPLSLYAKAKVAAETYLLSLRDRVDYHATVLRFATAFGLAPRMRFDLTGFRSADPACSRRAARCGLFRGVQWGRRREQSHQAADRKNGARARAARTRRVSGQQRRPTELSCRFSQGSRKAAVRSGLRCRLRHRGNHCSAEIASAR